MPHEHQASHKEAARLLQNRDPGDFTVEMAETADSERLPEQENHTGLKRGMLGGIGLIGGIVLLERYFRSTGVADQMPADEREDYDAAREFIRPETENSNPYLPQADAGKGAAAQLWAQFSSAILAHFGGAGQPPGAGSSAVAWPGTTSANRVAGMNPVSGVENGGLSATPLTETAQSLAYGGSYPLNDQQIAKEIARIDAIEIPDLSFLFSSRNKRAAPRTPKPDTNSLMSNFVIQDDQIEARLRDIASKLNSPSEFDSLFSEMISKVEKSKNVDTALNSQRPVLFLLSFIEMLMGLLVSHVESGDIGKIYHFMYLVLRQARTISERVASQETAAKVRKYNLSRQVPAPRHSEPGRDELDFYLQSDFPEFYGKGVRGTDKVVVHGSSNPRVFSLSQMIRQEHCSSAGCDRNVDRGAHMYHFLSDSSGIHTPNQIGFFRSLNTNRFKEFSNTAPYRKYIEQQADGLLQDVLRASAETSLYFNKTKQIQQIQERLQVTPLLATAQANAALTQELTRLSATPLPAINATEISARLFALESLMGLEAQLFNGMDDERVVLSDYIYSYLDDAGNKQWQTAKLPDLLSKDTGAENIEIAQRRQVQLHFPREFGPQLEASLSKIMQDVTGFWGELQWSKVLDQLRGELRTAMPSLIVELNDEMKKLCEGRQIWNCNLSDTVTVYYERLKFLLGSEPYQKTLTIAQIMMGGLKKTDATYYARDANITGFSRNVSANDRASYTGLIHLLSNADIQGQLMARLDETAKNGKIKGLFDSYVAQLDASVPGVHQRTQVFRNQPLLRVIKTVVTIDASPVTRYYLLSILTGDKYAFNSFVRMRDAVRGRNADFPAMAAHFSVDPDKQYDAGLENVDQNYNYFERIIAYQKSNIDALMVSKFDAHVLGLLEAVSELGPFLVGLFIGNPALGALLGTAMSVGGKALQANVLPLEKERIYKAALVNLAKSITDGGMGTRTSKFSGGLMRDAGKFHSGLLGQTIRSRSAKYAADLGAEKATSYTTDYLIDLFFSAMFGPNAEMSFPDLPVTEEINARDLKMVDLTGSFQALSWTFQNDTQGTSSTGV